MFLSEENFDFIPPPEAPVFEPDEEEWKDPIGYIAKIHPYAVKVGICKIRPPPEWQPPFSLDVDNFKFTPRIQKLNELEANTRVKLNFIDAIAKFWDLQGSQIKLPNVEKRPLDIHTLHKIVQEEGGFEDVTRLRRWSRIAYLMGYTSNASSGILRRHYEKILYPYDIFMSGAMTGDTENNAPPVSITKKEKKSEKEDPDFEPDDEEETPSSNILKRKSRNNADDAMQDDEIDYAKNPELKKLQFAAPGPKITGKRSKKEKFDPNDFVQETELLQPVSKNRKRQKKDDKVLKMLHSFVDDYRCQVCDNGNDEDCMLLCDSCDASYHTYCLIPQLPGIPAGDWRCPKCVVKECNKPLEAYGFEQAKRIYSLEDFSEMADKFKEEYFAMPPSKVPIRVVEKEFWRLVSSIDHDVAVEYAADLHTADHGSGFPTNTNTIDSDLSDYVESPWNLNNFPNNEKSVLKYITQDISGMKVPWIYVGMCFSSFCWHTEDHWSYSINFHHWGEPKTWYGVPESEAEKLEECVKKIAPELFKNNPDLFHHLVTLCSPNTLMNHGVPVFRTNQYPGEFVVTFPRAYHAGFNTGYNCAEAVNFCPADWLPVGQKCVKHYQSLKRATVFSHEELICKMATVPDTLDLDVAKKLYDCMRNVVAEEIEKRLKVHKIGITERQREAFELVNDEDRQCAHCKTTVFFSSIVCSCNKKRLACLFHAKELCPCPDYKKYIRYRYTLEELPEILANLKKRADSFDNWEKEVHDALSNTNEQKIEFLALKDFITEAEESQFPECDLLEQLRVYVNEAEQCAQVASQLLTKKHKTRKTTTTTVQAPAPRLTLTELKEFVNQVNNLPCVIKEAKAVDKLMGQVESFRYEAKQALSSDDYKEKKVMELLEHAETMDIDLPEINDLKLDLKASKWLESIDEILNQEQPISLDVIRSCVDQGIGLRKKQASEKPLSRLKELLYAADRWEEKAKLCLQAKPRHMMGTLEVIVQEASKVKIILPNVSALKDALHKAKDWTGKVEKLQNDDYYPYYDILEALVVKGRPVPVRLEQLPQMESQVAAARAWKDRTSRTFVKKGSNKLLMELLRPRKDVGKFERKPKKKKHQPSGSEGKPDKTNSKEKNTKKSDDKEPKEKKRKKLKEDPLTSPKSSNASTAIASTTEDEKTSNESQKKPIGLLVETINVDDYQAPDPLTVAQSLKQDEGEEIAAMKELRVKNQQKLVDENIDAPYCLCRKGLDGFMIRCNLCFDWYHTSCICPPKTVHGKPIGKGYNAWSATREVRYVCTLCCRSRRPRLDNILQLLMSLQKLPVRVPEGEALQFLTERSMNWQDRAKQALSDPEVHRIVSAAKTQADKILADRQAAVSANSNHNGTQLNILFYQRLLAVKKVHRETVDLVTAASAVVSDDVTDNKPVDITSSDETTNTIDSAMQVDTPELASAAVITLPLLEKPTTMNATNTPKAPSLDKKEETAVSVEVAPTTKSTTDGLEADLECTEEMISGSPVSSKPPNLSDPNVVRIQSAGSSRAQSPIDVCTPLDCLAAPSLATASTKPQSDDTPKTDSSTTEMVTMSELPAAFLDQMEELMFEGELLEVGLDEVQQIWAILQIQRPIAKDLCNIMNAEYRRKLIKERKRQRKRKIEEAKAAQQAEQAAKAAAVAASARAAKKLKEEALQVKKEEEAALLQVKIKEEPMDADQSMNESQDEDDCSARPCRKPLGDEVEWVQCDKCENWYHVVCVGISADDANNIDEYACPYCCKPPIPNIPMPVVPIKTEAMATAAAPTTTITPTPAPKIPDLSVIAEVAHQIITDQEKASSSIDTAASPPVVLENKPDIPAVVVENNPDTTTLQATPTPPPPPPLPPSNLDLNSLNFLADISQKMDVTPIVEVPAKKIEKMDVIPIVETPKTVAETPTPAPVVNTDNATDKQEEGGVSNNKTPTTPTIEISATAVATTEVSTVVT